jgi:hypothetical protein
MFFAKPNMGIISIEAITRTFLRLLHNLRESTSIESVLNCSFEAGYLWKEKNHVIEKYIYFWAHLKSYLRFGLGMP